MLELTFGTDAQPTELIKFDAANNEFFSPASTHTHTLALDGQLKEKEKQKRKECTENGNLIRTNRTDTQKIQVNSHEATTVVCITCKYV